MLSRILFLLIFSSWFSLSESKSVNPYNECLGYKKNILILKNDSKKLKMALDFIWSQWMHSNPEAATYVGFPGLDDQWTDLSVEAIQQRKKLPLCHRQLVKPISEKSLSQKEKITLKLIRKKIESQIAETHFPSEYLAIDQLSGIHTELIDLLISSPHNTLEDFNHQVSRLEKFPKKVDQTITLLELGLKNKVTPVKFLVEKVPEQIQTLIKSPKDSEVYKSFKNFPDHFSEAQKAEVLSKVESLIENHINPSLLRLKKFLENTYVPQCRETISISSLPMGNDWYNFLIEYHTSLKKTPEELHQLGLKEVARINDEMSALRKKINFKGNKSEFHQFLQNDPQFFFKSPKDLIGGYRDIAKQIDPELPKLFKELPRLPYGVKEISSFKASSAPTAYYQPGSISSGRSGFFEANTYNLNARPKWEMEVLTVHEAVPGHHLQISLAQELGELPEFRKHEGYTSFVEGWGLYSESLGDQLGLYKDPYSKYGQLSYEMWRAVRLVVDTGMHALGWSKQKALDYFMENVPKNKLQSEVEIDRYIAWPGQALAYKVGELKIKELKEKSINSLKDKFDIREFHFEVLKNGAVSLDILEDEINQWLSKKVKVVVK